MKKAAFLLVMVIGLIVLPAALPSGMVHQEGETGEMDHDNMTAEEMAAMESPPVPMNDLETMLGMLLFGVFGGLIVGGAGSQLLKDRFTTNQYVVIGLMTATGLIHLLIGFGGDWFLLLNGLGYLGLLIITFAPLNFVVPYRGQLRWLLIAYTAVTIIGYFATHLGTIDWLGLGVKLIELVLIAMLFLDSLGETPSSL